MTDFTEELKNSTDIFLGSNHKLAILLPGYLDSKDYQHIKTLSQELQKLNYSTATFNPTGTWDNGSIEQFSLTQYLKDLDAVINHLKNKQTFDQIILIGHSLGGQVAMTYAGTHPQDIFTVIGIMPSAGFTELDRAEEIFAKWNNQGFRLSSRHYPGNPEKVHTYKVPLSFLNDRLKYNTYNLIKNYNHPILFIAGNHDKTVLPEAIKKTFIAANEPKKYIELEGVIHDYRRYPHQVELINNTVIDFLRNQL